MQLQSYQGLVMTTRVIGSECLFPELTVCEKRWHISVHTLLRVLRQLMNG